MRKKVKTAFREKTNNIGEANERAAVRTTMAIKTK
jgi:hypothetical protein